MKLDLKSSLILVFFIAFVVFFLKWWIEGDSHRKENNKLKNDIKQIEHVRDSLKAEREQMDIRIKDLEKEINQTRARIALLDAQLIINKEDLKEANDKLLVLQNALAATKKKIEELKARPIKRTGSALINSIKEKTKL